MPVGSGGDGSSRSRFVIYGAGAIGAFLGSTLSRSGVEVALIARGEHYRVLAERGLSIETPAGATTERIPVFPHPSVVDFRQDDVVVLTMKSQDTEPALWELAVWAPQSITVVCLQNGVANESMALRRFPAVYGAAIFGTSAMYLSAGSVDVPGGTINGVIDLGRYPLGRDETAESIARTLVVSGWDAQTVEAIMTTKYTKLLDNLSNAVEVVIGLEGRGGRVAERVRQEGRLVLEHAGIAFGSTEEMQARRKAVIDARPSASTVARAASTWQSVNRGTGSVESDYLNGEIVLIAREHGIDAPVNALLARLANDVARSRRGIGDVGEEEFFELLEVR